MMRGLWFFELSVASIFGVLRIFRGWEPILGAEVVFLGVGSFIFWEFGYGFFSGCGCIDSVLRCWCSGGLGFLPGVR